MISAIVCSRDPKQFDLVQRNLRRTVGSTPLEILCVDNSQNQYGICAAYNLGVENSHGEILVFLHEDVFHLELNWGDKLVQKFAGDASIGVIGLAGTQFLNTDPPLWSWAGRPFLFGKIVHELDDGERFFMTVFSPDSGDREVVAVDGCWFAVRKEVFAQVHFDTETFRGFHFYDIDFCMQARQHWKVIATTDILIKHQSSGDFDEHWQSEATRFRSKWSKNLPAVVDGLTVPHSRGSDFFNVNLKGKLPQTTLL